MRLPLTLMTRFTDAYINGSQKEPKVKFLTYSTHDWTVAQTLLFLDPDCETFEVLPFASQIKLELHSTKECKSEDCFWVEAIYNGKLLSFEGECEDASHCTYPEFMQLIQFRGFVNTKTHYEHECAKKWSPTSNSIQNFLYRHFSS